MGSAKGDRYDKSAVIYSLICEAEEPKNALRYFLENADYIDSSEEQEVEAYFTAQQLQKYQKNYSDLIDALLTKLVTGHYKKERFYDELWESVLNSDVLFDEEDVKIYAIGRIWCDPRIPYFCVNDGVKMSNEEFAGIIEKNKELLQEVTFILGCKYEQKTEISSRLLELLEKCSDSKDKVVVMAKIIDLVEKRCMLSILSNQN